MRFAEDQAASRMVLIDGTVLTKCDQCRQMYAERTPPEEPPCDTCRVDLQAENEEAASVFLAVRSQVVSYEVSEQKRILSLSIPAIKAVMDIYGVSDQRTCLARVQRLFNEVGIQEPDE